MIVEAELNQQGMLIAKRFSRLKKGENREEVVERLPVVKYGMEAGTTIRFDAARNPIFQLVNGIFGIDEVEMSISGSKEGDDPPELTIEAGTEVSLVGKDEVLLKVVREFFGVETVKLQFLLEKTSAGDTNISAEAIALLSMRSMNNPVMKFLLDLFGVEDLTMDLRIGIAKIGSQTIFGVSSTTVVSLGDSNSDFFQMIQEIFAVEEITVFIGVSTSEFEISIDLGLDAEISDAVSLVNAFIQIQLEHTPPPPESYIGLGLTFQFDTEDSVIKLTGELGVTTGATGVSVDGTVYMQGKWHNPLGLEGLVVADLAAMVGIQPDPPWVSKVGFAGKLELGRTYMELAMKIDIDNPRKSGFVGEVKNLSLAEVVNTLTGPDNTIPKELSYALEDVRLNHFKLSIIPIPPLEIGALVYNDEGITALCDLKLWDFEAFMYMQVNYTDGITAFASFSDIELIPGVLKISRFNSSDNRSGADMVQIGDRFVSKGGPELYIRLSPYDAPEIFIQGRVTVLSGLMESAVAIYLNEEGLAFIAEGGLFGDLFQVRLEALVARDFSSIYLKAEMKNDFFAKMREGVTAGIKKAADAALAEIRNAKAEVEKIYGEIERMRLTVKREREAVQRKLRSARSSVRSAQREVNKIKRSINSTKRYYNSLPATNWPWKPSKAREWVWVGPKLAGLYTAYGVATAALEAAKLVLKGIEKLIEVIPIDADPRIVALFAAYEIAKGALDCCRGCCGRGGVSGH